jgi:hypothetical protein
MCDPFPRLRHRRQGREELATGMALSDVTFASRNETKAETTTVMSFACARPSRGFHY